MTTTTDPTLTDPTLTDATSSSSTTTPVALTAPVLTLDQADTDYAPGETVGITASNVAVGGAVTFDVEHVLAGGMAVSDLTGTGTPWTVTDGGAGDLDGVANGVIQTSWYVNSDASNQAFVLTATDAASGATATTNFTDAAIMSDLTFQNTVTINGAIFSTTTATIGAGTGLIDPFSQVQAQGNNTTEVGYNTGSKTQVLDNAGKGGSNFIHAVNLADIPIEFKNGVGYYRFELDINQSNTAAGQNLSLDNVQVWQASDPNLTTYNPGAHVDQGTGILTGGGATKAYDLDSSGDVFVGLNGNLEPGSGNTVDMSLLVPVANFTG